MRKNIKLKAALALSQLLSTYLLAPPINFNLKSSLKLNRNTINQKETGERWNQVLNQESR